MCLTCQSVSVNLDLPSWLSVCVNFDLFLSQLADSICQNWPLSVSVGCQYLSILSFVFLSWLSVFVNLNLCLFKYLSILTFVFLSWLSVFVNLVLCLSQLAVSICQTYPLSVSVGCQYLSILTFVFISWLSVFVNLDLCLSQLLSVFVKLTLCLSQLAVSICQSWPLSFSVDCQYLSILTFVFLSWPSVFVNLNLCLFKNLSILTFVFLS